MTTRQFQESSALRIFLSYFKPHRKLFFLDMCCALMIAVIDLAFPYVSRWCMYQLLPESAYRTFFAVMAVVFCAYILRSVFTYIICYYGHTFGILVEADIRRDLFRHMQELSFDYYDRNRTGQLMSRLTADLFDITELAHHGPEDIFISGVTIVGALAIMFTIQWQLALVIACIIPVFFLVVWKCRKSMQDASIKVKQRTATINADIESGLSGIKTAKAFDEGVDFTGVVLSKLDGDARGGAALSVASVTGKPILFASNGEGLKDFEVFHPDRMASRILDMGDIMTLIEQAQKQFDEEEARKAAEKISEGSFGLDDFLDQLQQVRKLGSMKSLLGMIPGMAQHRKELEQFDEREIDRTEAIIRSMTPAERRDPSIINGSRRARIAYGSGVTVSQVNALLQRFEQAAKMMKRMSNRGGMGGGIPGFGGPAMGGGKKKGKNKKKGGKSGNPMKREAEEKALRDKLAGKSSGSTGGSAFAKKPQNPALPAGLEQMMGNVDGGTELPPNLGGGLGGLFGR